MDQASLIRIGDIRLELHDDPLAHAGEVRTPCLVTRGGNDRIVPEDAAKELAAALPRGEYQALDHTAHAAEYNTPDLFVAATLEFIGRVESSAQHLEVSDKKSSVKKI